MSSTDIRLSFGEDIGPKKKYSDAFLQGKYCSCPSLVPSVKISEAITNCIDLGRPYKRDANNNLAFVQTRVRQVYRVNRKQAEPRVLGKIDDYDNEYESMEDLTSSQSSGSSESLFVLSNRSHSVPRLFPYYTGHAGDKLFDGLDVRCGNKHSASWPELPKVTKFEILELEDMISDEENFDD